MRGRAPRSTRPRSAATKRTSTYAWRKRRAMILARDRRRCRYCGAKATEVDHIIPVTRGGTDHPDNLAASCWDCNHGGNVAIKQRLLAEQGGGGKEFRGPDPKLRRDLSLPAPGSPRVSRAW